MVRVSIDVDAGTAFFNEASALLDRVIEEWSDVATAARNGLTSTRPVRGLEAPYQQLVALREDLRTRVELAVLYNSNSRNPVPAGEPIVLEIADETTAGVKAQLGQELAEALTAINGTDQTREGVESIDAVAALLAKYADDAAVTDALFDTLGPDGVVRIPLFLRQYSEEYAAANPASTEDLHWDEDTPMSLHLDEVEQRFLEAYGTAFATTTNSAAFNTAHPDFAKDLVDYVCDVPDGSGWSLSQILRYGDFDSAFLVTVGEELYEFEQDQFGPVWGPQLNGSVQNWHLGTADDTGFYDPFVGLFGAMGRNPEAALDFLNPDSGGPVATDRAKYLIQDRRWSHDDFNALGLALDAAATRFHTSSAPVELQERSAWMASATIHFLAERDGGRHDRRIGDAGKDSLAHILAAYITDVDRTANGTSGGLGVIDNLESSPWKAGWPVGADFSVDDLRAVMGEVLTDMSAVEQMAAASNALNAERIRYGAAQWGGAGTDPTALQVALNQSSTLNGFVVAVMGAGLEDEARELDEQAQAYIDLTSDVIGMIPTGGTFTSFLADQTVSAGKDLAGSQWTGNESRVKDEQHTVQQVAYTDLQIAMMIALAENGHIPQDGMTYTDDGTVQYYPWFAPDGFDPDVLADPGVRNQFIEWAGSVDAGSAAAALRPDIAAMFEAGFNRGKPR